MLRILIGDSEARDWPCDPTRYEVRLGGQAVSIAAMLARFPDGWTPDIYLHTDLVRFTLPADIETFPGLTAACLPHWIHGGRGLWAGAGFVDVIATNRGGRSLLAANDYTNTLPAHFGGVDLAQQQSLPDLKRDIDVLWVGDWANNAGSGLDRWLDRLARLSARYKVQIVGACDPETEAQWLHRAKIVFQRSPDGGIPTRAYQAFGAGALVLLDGTSEECHDTFAEGVHCAYYDADSLETVIAHYLERDVEREKVAAQGWELAWTQHTIQAHNDALFAALESKLTARARPAALLTSEERVRCRIFQILSSDSLEPASTALAQLDTLTGLDSLSADADPALRGGLLTGQAVMTAWTATTGSNSETIARLSRAVDLARRAVRADRSRLNAQITLAFLLLERAQATGGQYPTGKNDVAEAAVTLANIAEGCEIALGMREPNPTGSDDPNVDEAVSATRLADFGAQLDGPLYTLRHTGFQTRIEQAYWLRGINAEEFAQALCPAIASRCRSLLSGVAEANSQIEEAYRQSLIAALVLPEEAETLFRLAYLEATTGRLQDALDHYRDGLALAPLTPTVWQEFAALLHTVGLKEEAQAFVADRLTVIAALPEFAALRDALEQVIFIQPDT